MRRKIEARATVEVSQADSGFNGEFNDGPPRELVKVLEELEMFAKTNRKAEIESIESCSNGVHRGKYLTHFYLNRFLEPLVQQHYHQHQHTHHQQPHLSQHDTADPFHEIDMQHFPNNELHEPHGNMNPENELYQCRSLPHSYTEPDFNSDLSQFYNTQNEMIANCTIDFSPPSPPPHFY